MHALKKDAVAAQLLVGRVGRRVLLILGRSASAPWDLAGAGVVRVPRVAGVRNGLPLLEDGRVLDVANVVWCTGFDPGFSWLDLPVFGTNGEPRHEAGVVPSEPGLYFVGLHFLYAFSSDMIHGVGRDAARIAEAVATRASSRVPLHTAGVRIQATA